MADISNKNVFIKSTTDAKTSNTFNTFNTGAISFTVIGELQGTEFIRLQQVQNGLNTDVMSNGMYFELTSDSNRLYLINEPGTFVIRKSATINAVSVIADSQLAFYHDPV